VQHGGTTAMFIGCSLEVDLTGRSIAITVGAAFRVLPPPMDE